MLHATHIAAGEVDLGVAQRLALALLLELLERLRSAHAGRLPSGAAPAWMRASRARRRGVDVGPEGQSGYLATQVDQMRLLNCARANEHPAAALLGHTPTAHCACRAQRQSSVLH
jgi:hypothetical protein